MISILDAQNVATICAGGWLKRPIDKNLRTRTSHAVRMSHSTHQGIALPGPCPLRGCRLRAVAEFSVQHLSRCARLYIQAVSFGHLATHQYRNKVENFVVIDLADPSDTRLVRISLLREIVSSVPGTESMLERRFNKPAHDPRLDTIRASTCVQQALCKRKAATCY